MIYLEYPSKAFLKNSRFYKKLLDWAFFSENSYRITWDSDCNHLLKRHVKGISFLQETLRPEAYLLYKWEADYTAAEMKYFCVCEERKSVIFYFCETDYITFSLWPIDFLHVSLYFIEGFSTVCIYYFQWSLLWLLKIRETYIWLI